MSGFPWEHLPFGMLKTCSLSVTTCHNCLTQLRLFFVIQISSLTHCPFSVIAKAGTVIETEHLLETLPVAWELLLDEDQQLVSSAGRSMVTGRRG